MQVQLHPSILPADFDITPTGDLVLNLPGADANESRAQNGAPSAVLAPAPAISAAAPSPAQHLVEAPAYDGHFQQMCESAAQGREVKYINLFKPDGSSLGFSVVGLKSEHKGELGIYVQEIQPQGIACKDGQLIEGDQILAIDGQFLDSQISHQQAITILQKARGIVHLVIARNLPTAATGAAGKADESSSKPPAKSASEIGFPSDYCQVEVIDLVNNGSGLGFGIIGGQQPGVVVKTILPNGVADADGRLRAGDFILQINEHWLQGVASDQVAKVLRGTGNHVRLIVARPVDLEDTGATASEILSSAILMNREELEAHLQLNSSVAGGQGYGGPSTALAQDMVLPKQSEKVSISGKSKGAAPSTIAAAAATAMTTPAGATEMMPEMETLEVELTKDSQGLGITIAGRRFAKQLANKYLISYLFPGYTCEREELSGIFVKSVTEGSSAHRSGKVAVNDQIVEVDGRSIQGYSNQQVFSIFFFRLSCANNLT